MPMLAGEPVDAADLTFPDPATGYANGVNSISATSFADLPTIGCTATIVNPHPTAGMLVDVRFAAWMVATAGDVRACPRISGSLTVAAGVGSGPTGWGELLFGANSSDGPVQSSASYTIELPPGSATFTMQAFQSGAAGTKQVNYASLRIVPIRYAF